MQKPELLAPAGSYPALMAAINAGADAIYFGVDGFNMRQNNSQRFTLDDLQEIAKRCHEHKIKCYLALNTLVYDENMAGMHQVIDAAKANGIDALIMFDPSAIEYARSIGIEVHISTQHSISNIETVKFFSRWADRMVLARELSLEQIKKIIDEIKKQNIRGPKGNLIEIEIFIHGAMCVSVSGRCGMSLYMNNTSANCGECTQPCRRAYEVKDTQTGKSLVIDNQFVMSPEDLCTIGLLDEIMATGAASLKIEGRGRAPEYVETVVRTYREAMTAVENKTYNEEKIKIWNERLGTVFNKGLSDGFYRGKAWKYWSGAAGNKASQVKEFVGTVVKYYPKIQVAEIDVHASELSDGDEAMFIGKTTGVLRVQPEAMMIDEKPVKKVKQGDAVTFTVPSPVRRGDKLYKVVKL